MDDKQKLYNTYISTDMSESELIARLDQIQAKSVKNNGVVYTPQYIVSAMVELAKPTPDMTILEPSCGHGVFLFELLSYMEKHFNLTEYQLYQWFINKVTAIDLSNSTIAELNDILVLYFYKRHRIHVDTFNNVIATDTLLTGTTTYDIVIGNPPYIRTKNLNEQYLKQLRTNFKSCNKGNIDIYYAFIEKCFNISTQLCFIVPNSWLSNVSAKVLREMIKHNISTLIDFKDKLVFQDARTYTCILQTTKNNTTDIQYANDINSPLEIKSVDELFNTNVAHSNIEPVLSGIATLCDSIYKVVKINNQYYATFDNVQYEIEKNIIVPYLKLTKIKENVLEYDYMIYPYDNNKNIINEQTLQTSYPLAYHYLTTTRHKLDKRDKGKTEKYEQWYAYGRKQGLHQYTSTEIIVIPGMIGKNCKPIKVNIQPLLDEFPTIVFTSGFIIPYKTEYESILSDNFISFAKLVGKQWPGKEEPYYSLTSKNIKTFKI